MTGHSNTHIDSLLSWSLGKEINQAHRFSELKNRTKLLRRLPQVSLMPQTVPAWPPLPKHVRLGSEHPDNSEHLQPAASGLVNSLQV